jgi:putative tryptophan/tyrosine transport system substrate-binding protein
MFPARLLRLNRLSNLLLCRNSRCSGCSKHPSPQVERKVLKFWIVIDQWTIYCRLVLPLNSNLKKVGLGVFLILGASAVLLYSDLGSRNGGKSRDSTRLLQVALVQQTSIPTLDEGIAGVLDAMKDRGYVDGGRIALHRFNAEGDIATANAVATEVTSGDNDLVLTISTISLQTVANANQRANKPRHHVFGIVTDPYAVGVGVSSENHSIHPPYMTGIGSMPPIGGLFQLARQMRPGLKRVGLVWNPAEANSVIATKAGRAVCASMGIELVEANAENATMVGDAVASVLARNVEAIWVSPDLTISHGLDVIIRKAKLAKVPVFSSLPTAKVSGTLFDLGANYHAIGYEIGKIAADVLDGRDPATIPVENMTPAKLQINRLAVKDLRDAWTIPDTALANADVIVDESGRHAKSDLATSAAADNKIASPGGAPGK